MRENQPKQPTPKPPKTPAENPSQLKVNMASKKEGFDSLVWIKIFTKKLIIGVGNIFNN